MFKQSYSKCAHGEDVAAAQLGTQKHSLPTTQQCQPDAFMYLVAFVVIVILSSTHVSLLPSRGSESNKKLGAQTLHV